MPSADVYWKKERKKNENVSFPLSKGLRLPMGGAVRGAGLQGPPEASCGSVEPPGASWNLLELPVASWIPAVPPGGSSIFPEPSWASSGLVEPPVASWGLLELPEASWGLLTRGAAGKGVGSRKAQIFESRGLYFSLAPRAGGQREKNNSRPQARGGSASRVPHSPLGVWVTIPGTDLSPPAPSETRTSTGAGRL